MKYLTLFFFVLYSSLAFSQVEVYRTFQDFENDNGEKFDDLDIYYFDKPENRLDYYKFYKNRTKIKSKDIWGFKYKNSLFRIDHDNPRHSSARVIVKNKLVYYENGRSHLEMLESGRSSASYSQFQGYSAYISLNLNSMMIVLDEYIHGLAGKKRAKKRIRKFRDENPEFNEFFDCLRNYRIETVRRCISEFEGYDLNQ